MRPKTITTEGPAASGKSTIGRLLAAALGYTFIDSGALYRIIAHNVLVKGVSADDEKSVVDVVNLLEIEIVSTDTEHAPMILVDGKQMDKEKLYTSMIDQIVPIVARYQQVRERIREIQRNAAAHGRIVMSGRDIGTVVLPDAELKIYLDVSAEERARRRHLEKVSLGATATEAKILKDIKRRDSLDENREISPMRPADDALIIQADHLTPSEIVDSILRCFHTPTPEGERG
jgi:cytidylate kinase